MGLKMNIIQSMLVFIKETVWSIAAHKLGFEFVGCELDKDYFEAQEKRFKLETMQQSLF